MIGLFKRPQTNRKDNEKGMQFACQQPLLLGGALRDSPKNGCEGDYKNTGPTLLKKVHFFTKGGAVFVIEGRLNVRFFCSDLMC